MSLKRLSKEGNFRGLVQWKPSEMETGLVRLGCGVTDRVAYKQFISYSSGGWRSEIRVPVWSGEDPLPGHRPLTVSSHSGKNQEALRGLSHKSTNPTSEGSTLVT